MTVAVYVRRWGPRGFAWGMVAFNGAFLGFFLHAQLGLRDVGWLAADLAIGVLASLIVRFAFFRPRPGADARAHAPVVGGAGPPAARDERGGAGARTTSRDCGGCGSGCAGNWCGSTSRR